MSLPLLPLTLAVALGLAAGDQWPLEAWPGWQLTALFLLLSLSLHPRLALARAAAMVSIFFSLGWTATSPAVSPRAASLSALDDLSDVVLEGFLTDYSPTSPGTGRAAVSLERRCSRLGCASISGRLQLRWEGTAPPLYTPVRFSPKLQRFPENLTSQADDNAARAWREGFVRQGTVSSDAWLPVFRETEHGRFSAHQADWSLLSRHRENLRQKLKAFFLEHARGEAAGLMVGLVLGDRSYLAAQTRDQFARAGLAHLLAISGSHLALVALGSEWLLRLLLLLLPWSRRLPVLTLAPLGALTMTLFYAALVGLSPPIARATLMVGVALALRASDRKTTGPAILILAAWTLLLLDPTSLWDVGCQLSFASVAALMTLAPGMTQRWTAVLGRLPEAGRVPRALKTVLGALGGLVCTSLAATIATMPICALYFGSIPWVGVLANIPAVPLLGAISLPVLLAAGTCGVLGFPGGAALVKLGEWLAEWGLVLGTFFGATPAFAPIEIGLSGTQALVWLVGIGGLVCTGGRRWLLLGGATLAWTLLSLAQAPAQSAPGMEVFMLDVGQGDCTVLRMPDGQVIMVDGGGSARYPTRSRGSSSDLERSAEMSDPARKVIVPFLRRQGIQRISLMVLSHPHPDHLGGLAGLVGQLPIGAVWVGSPPGKEGAYADFIDALENRRIPWTIIDANSRLPSLGGARVRCLHPSVGWEERVSKAARKDANNASLVLQITLGEADFLLTGDIEAEVEDQLVADGALTAVDVMKIPHHGSDTSSSEAFVQLTRPRVALVGVGRENRFRFPRWWPARRWRQVGAQLLRTDLHGTIRLWTDGHQLQAWRQEGAQPILTGTWDLAQP